MKGKIMDPKIYNPTKPVEIFNYLVSNDKQHIIVKAVSEQYKKAHRHCYGTFLPAEARDLLPLYRRTCIEDIMPDLAARIGNCDSKPRKNKAKNCSHRLMVNNRIILTQSKVESPGILPKNAEFRKGYAKTPQMVFEFMGEDKVSEKENEACLYALIVHMPVENDNRLPLFVDIIFPDKDFKVILGRIKLLDKFPDIIPVISQEESIPNDSDIKQEPSVKRSDSETA